MNSLLVVSCIFLSEYEIQDTVGQCKHSNLYLCSIIKKIDCLMCTYDDTVAEKNCLLKFRGE